MENNVPVGQPQSTATSTKSKVSTKAVVGLALLGVAAAFAIVYFVRAAVGDGIANVMSVDKSGTVTLPGELGKTN